MVTNSQTHAPVTPADLRSDVAAALGVAAESIDPETDLVAQGLSLIHI